MIFAFSDTVISFKDVCCTRGFVMWVNIQLLRFILPNREVQKFCVSVFGGIRMIRCYLFNRVAVSLAFRVNIWNALLKYEDVFPNKYLTLHCIGLCSIVFLLCWFWHWYWYCIGLNCLCYVAFMLWHIISYSMLSCHNMIYASNDISKYVYIYFLVEFGISHWRPIPCKESSGGGIFRTCEPVNNLGHVSQ